MQALHATGRTSDAVRAFHDYRVFLAHETGLAPSADLAALERALVASPPVREPVAVEPPDGVLPEPATSFLGRDAAIDELIELLTSNRIVTLVGPGGVGKTRLAIEVARAARIRAPTTAWFVELVALRAEEVAPAVARTLDMGDGVEPVEALRHALTGRSDLIVLDNCEHLVEAAAALVEGLSSYCPSIRFLTTSRTRLGVAGEVGLGRPAADDSRHRRARPARRPRSPCRDPVVPRPGRGGRRDDRRCTRPRPHHRRDLRRRRRPAARDRAGGGAEPRVAAHPRRRRPRLEPGAGGGDRVAGRHRSLDAAIGWGYDVLSPVAQLLVRRLAVFEGGWTIDAAEAVCGGDGVEDVPEVLAGLVAASFVTFAPSNDRYAMLETVRVFARVRLAASGEIERRRDAHLTWCRTLVDGCRSGLASELAAGLRWQRLERERPNLRAALRWAIDDDRHLTDAEQLALGLNVFWRVTGDPRGRVAGCGASSIARDPSRRTGSRSRWISVTSCRPSVT